MDPNKHKTKKVLLRAMTSALGYYIFGYNLGIFTSSQDCVASILGWSSNKSLLIILVSSYIPLGAFIGSILTGFFSKSRGERQSIMFIDILTIFLSLLALFPNTYTFSIFRLLSGICTGSYSILCSQYTSKYTPKTIRGKMGALNQVFVLSGIFSAYSVCIPLPTSSCSPEDGFAVFTIFAFPGVVALIQFLLFFKVFRKETPIYLMRNEKPDQALEAIKSVYSNGSVQNHYESLIKTDKLVKEKSSSSYKEIFCCATEVRKPMRVCLLFHVFSQLSGINAMLAFTTRILIEFGEGVLMARVWSSCITLIRVVFVVLVLPFLDRFGRKTIAVFGQLAMTACVGFIALFALFDILEVGKVLLLTGNLVAFSLSSGPFVWTYTSEVAPDKGVAVCTSVNWIIGFGIVIAVPLVMESFGVFVTFAMLAGIDLLGAAYLAFEMIETKGLSRHEVIERFLA